VETIRIFVQPFPPTGAKWQVPTGGGVQPEWQRDGKELFYVASNRKLMAAEVRTGAVFQFRAPQVLFQTQILTEAGDACPKHVVSAWQQLALAPPGPDRLRRSC